MADVKARKTHNLSIDEAKQTAQQLADKLKNDYELESSWKGDTLVFNRSGLKGQLKVSDKDVDIEISLGFMLKAFKGKIQAEVDKSLDKLFA